MSLRDGRRSAGQLFLIASAIFVLSRLADFAGGLTFMSEPLGTWQHIDVELLRHHLFQSLLYDPAQPPLFNLFLGLVLKSAGAHAIAVFAALYTAMGAALYWTTYTLARRLDISRWTAFVVVSVYAISPAFVLSEQWLTYNLPLALLLALSALAFERYARVRRPLAGMIFFLLLAALCLTHNLFHAGLIVLAALVLIYRKGFAPRAVLPGAALALSLVLAVYGKNWVIFGELSSSSWMGMNLALHRIDSLPLPLRRQLVERGALSPASLTKPFSTLGSYPVEYRAIPPRFAGVPVLATLNKSTGEQNYHSYAYVTISKHYLADVKFLLVNHPIIWLKSLGGAVYNYFNSMSSFFQFQPRLQASRWMRAQCWVFERLLGARLGKLRFSLSLFVFIPLAVGYALRRARLLALPAREDASRAAQRLVLDYLVAAISYVAAIGVVFNAVENERLRAMTDPLLVVCLALWIDGWLLPRLCSYLKAKTLTA